MRSPPYRISFRRKASRPTAVAAASHASPAAQHRAHVVPPKGHVFQILQHDPRHKLPQHLKCRVEQDSKRL